MRTRSFSFRGANIKGTPSMPASAVTNDVRKIFARAHVGVVQEFRHRWYWTIIRTLLGVRWRSSPGFLTGVARPARGGQAVFWKRKWFKKVTSRIVEAFDFHLNHAGIMEDRWIRAVLLEEIKSRLHCWFMSMHAVVHGDDHGEGPRRQVFMHQNLDRLDDMLTIITRNDAPVAFEADMNIHKGTWAYDELMRIVNKHHGRILGEPGVEFLIVFDHHCATKIVVEKVYSLAPKAAGLKTDHEVRCFDFHLQK